MSKRITIITVLLSALVFAGCEKFEFDPNQSVDLTSEEQLNYNNINKLQLEHADSSIDFVLMGDSHIDYENMEKLVNAVNARNDIDFLVHTGDLTEHGILQQYKQTADYLQKLDRPFITAVGNHDLVGNGESMYRHMFGHLNYSFVYAGVKFIFFNSNSREYGFNGKVPDLNWVQQEMNGPEKFSRIVLVSHVPFFDKDFDQAMRQSYLNLITNHQGKPILLSLNGHLHDGFIDTPPEAGILHLAAGSVNRKAYILVHIKGSDVSYEKISF
jgi:predicted phosphodiesterase